MNNLHSDYRGKPNEPSPCALPGAQGRPGQSISVSAQGVADGAEAVCSQWGTPDPGSLSGMQERGGCTTVGEKRSVPRMSSQEDKAGGNRRQVPDSHECWGSKRASVPPLTDLHHLLFPISQGHIPAGMVSSHNSLHHSMGRGPANTLPEPHNPHHPAVSSKSVANPRWTHRATLPVHRPSGAPVASSPLPEQCPGPLSSTGEELGHRHLLSH